MEKNERTGENWRKTRKKTERFLQMKKTREFCIQTGENWRKLAKTRENSEILEKTRENVILICK